jgi:hypothetical protein
MWRHLELLNDVIRIMTFTHDTGRAAKHEIMPRDFEPRPRETVLPHGRDGRGFPGF